MKSLFLGICLLLPGFLFAQQQAASTNNKPAYFYFTKVPPFEMTLINGKTFSEKDLKKNKPVLIFMFLPDCKYCHLEMNLIAAEMEKLKHVQIIMVTSGSKEEMITYYQQAGFDKFPNIKMGWQPNRALLGFYGLEYFPGLYLYSKENKIVYHHEGTIPVDTLLNYLH